MMEIQHIKCNMIYGQSSKLRSSNNRTLWWFADPSELQIGFSLQCLSSGTPVWNVFNPLAVISTAKSYSADIWHMGSQFYTDL